MTCLAVVRNFLQFFIDCSQFSTLHFSFFIFIHFWYEVLERAVKVSVTSITFFFESHRKQFLRLQTFFVPGCIYACSGAWALSHDIWIICFLFTIYFSSSSSSHLSIFSLSHKVVFLSNKHTHTQLSLTWWRFLYFFFGFLLFLFTLVLFLSQVQAWHKKRRRRRRKKLKVSTTKGFF